jgi:outer membrane protein OmpA-like peptidoglycan-associated protein
MKNEVYPNYGKQTYALVSFCKKSVTLLVATCLYLSASSQSFVGYGYDNYSGVNGVLLNPGSLPDSKYKVSVNIFSVSALAGNNAFELDRSRLFGLKFSGMSLGNGYTKSANVDYKYAYFNTDVVGPSATIALTPSDGLGLITRMRVIGNSYNVSNPLFQLMGNADPNFYNTDIINRSLQNKMNAFAEAGISYGRVVMKNDRSELKIGITGKYIVGLGYASLSSGQMNLNIQPNHNITTLDADMTAQYSGNLNNVGNGTSLASQLRKGTGKGLGLDLGFVYEWKQRNDPSEYKMRLGMSVTDLGSVKYTNSANSQVYTVTADGHNTSELVKQDNETYDGYINRLKTGGLVVPKGLAPMGKVMLPTAFHFNLDYNVYKRIYIDADVLFNTMAENNPISPNYITTFTVTPRLEKKWLSIYSPVSYNVQGQVNWGAGVRFGPMFVGSGTVLSSLIKQHIQTADVHVGLTIPIFQHTNKEDKKHNKTDTIYRNKDLTHDRDGDGVVDEKDECPDSAGPIALIGCPDRDGDGVADKHDRCPDVKGSPNFQGCPAPDSDGDSVNDDEDKCPLVPGLRSNYGCPPINPVYITSVNHAADRIFFVRAKAIIEKNSLPELDRVVTILLQDSTLRLRIEGNTDSEGTDERNERLSMRRARAVYFYLQKQGIAGTRLDYIGYGSKHPIAPNETREGMAQNRRVEMVLTNYPKDKK